VVGKKERKEKIHIAKERSMAFQSFKDLKVWQEGTALAISIYKSTMMGPFSHDYGFRDQYRRAAVSIPSNIAEGYNRGSNREFTRFLNISQGSIAELQTHLVIANAIDYIAEADFLDLDNRCVKISSMITNLKKARHNY
jgi:four helix bundle protein